MEIHSFLLDIIKLIITISIGVLSLSIGFIDKLNIDLNDKTVKTTITGLWVSLLVAVIFSVLTSFSIYLDVEYYKKSQILSQAITLNEKEILTLVDSLIQSDEVKANEVVDKIKVLKDPILVRSWQTKTSFLLTIIPFLISIIFLIRIGYLTIKQRMKTDMTIKKPEVEIQEPS